MHYKYYIIVHIKKKTTLTTYAHHLLIEGEYSLQQH